MRSWPELTAGIRLREIYWIMFINLNLNSAIEKANVRVNRKANEKSAHLLQPTSAVQCRFGGAEDLR